MMSKLSGSGSGGHSSGASAATAAGKDSNSGPNNSSNTGTTSPVRHNHLTYQHGHSFIKKTFHKPTNCHYCGELLWGLMGQGYICEVCNIIVHEKCLKTVTLPCVSIAATLVKNPVAHVWSDRTLIKRKFCNVCRKKIEDVLGLSCEGNAIQRAKRAEFYIEICANLSSCLHLIL